mgnify:FL=1
MKLIDLLVQELPKRGGWPNGAEYCHLTQYDRHCLTIVFSHKQVDAVNNPIISKEEMVFSGIGYLGDTLYGCIVTAKEYESALAASQKPAWSGEGLPPVGCECESKQFSQVDWAKFKVVAVCDGHVFGFWGNGVSTALDSKMWEFRPLRTEAERKRDAAIEAMQREADDGDNWIYSEYEIIYDAIAAGKIPGVKLED